MAILCDLDPKVKALGENAGTCDCVSSTAAVVEFIKLVEEKSSPGFLSVFRSLLNKFTNTGFYLSHDI